MRAVTINCEFNLPRLSYLGDVDDLYRSRSNKHTWYLSMRIRSLPCKITHKYIYIYTHTPLPVSRVFGARPELCMHAHIYSISGVRYLESGTVAQ